MKGCINLLLTLCLALGLLPTAELSAGFAIQDDEKSSTVARDEPGFLPLVQQHKSVAL